MKFYLKNIKLFGYHGLYENEKKNGQNFILNIAYESKPNELLEYPDYSLVYKDVKSTFYKKRHDLLETLAIDIATYIKDAFSDIDVIKVKISKISPQGCDDLEHISVEYEL